MTAAETETLPTLHMPVAGDRCANCGAPLAADQRYCLECGERRAGVAVPAARTSRRSVAETTAVERRRSGPPAGTTLVAGVATLLLAIGIGVLIGRSGHNGSTNAKAPPVRVQVTVPGSGGSTSAATTTPAGTGTTGAAAPKTTTGAKPKASHTNAAANSVGATQKNGTVKKTPGKVVTVGSKGHGPGYQNGKFTGNFFGP